MDCISTLCPKNCFFPSILRKHLNEVLVSSCSALASIFDLVTAVVSLGPTVLADPNKDSEVLLDSLPSHLNVGDEYEGFTSTAMTESPQQRKQQTR